MIELPPFEMMVDKAIYAMLIPALVAGVVFLVSSKFVPRCGDLVGGAAAMVSAFVVANFFLGDVKFANLPDDSFSIIELAQGMKRSFLPAVEGEPRGFTARYAFPWTVLVASLIGLVARHPSIPLAVGWLLRSVAALLAARLLVDHSLRAEIPWLWPVFALTVLALWGLLESLASEAKGGWIPLAIGIVFLAGGAVLIHAHSALLTDIALLLGWAFFGVAAVAWVRKADASAVAPIAAVALPGLLLLGQQLTVSEVPVWSFLLIALSPLSLIPLLLLRAKEVRGRVLALVAVGLLFIPVFAGVALAMMAESISFG